MFPKNIKPRKYQEQLFQLIREALRQYRAVCVEAPTGSGKSVLAAMIVYAFEELNKIWKVDRHIYFLVNETFLLEQFSKHLEKWHVSHDVIGNGKYEGRPVNVHVCTVQTLRNHPPEHEPSLFIVDEAQDSTAPQYMGLFNNHPNAKVIGITASPEGPAGKGLSKKSGFGIFDILINSPVSMLDLTEMGFLCPISYWSIPTRDYDDVSVIQGDFRIKEIDELMQKKGVFGDAVEQLKRFPEIRDHILVFCKSVDACYKMQTVFQAAGWITDVMEGSLSKTERKRIMSDFEDGKSQILVSCKMVLKGVDIPQLKMCIDLAPTLSRMWWKQKVGRVARAYEGKDKGYYLDMVGNIQRATKTGWVYEPIDWHFDSMKFNKNTPSLEAADVYCPLCYGYVGPNATVCPHCGAILEEHHKAIKKEKEIHMEGDLIESKFVPLRDRAPEEKKEVQDAISAALRDDDIEKLKEIGKSICNNPKNVPFFVYHKMSTKKKLVDIPLLYRIQRSFEYKTGWVWFAKKQLEREIKG